MKKITCLAFILVSLMTSCQDNESLNLDDSNSVRLRMMAANITSGSKQTYDLGHGIRQFQAMKPDIVMIQEFNYTSGPIRDFIDNAFGTEYEYFRGTVVSGFLGDGIPNGIISKYPILESGQWEAVYRQEPGNPASEIPAYQDRLYAWAVIDIPGDKDLLAISVHLHTNDHGMEMEPLTEKISAKQKEGNYYVVLGGDFNTKDGANNMRATVTDNPVMSSFFKTSGPYPVDQKNNEATNRNRVSPLDWVLFDKEFDRYEVPVIIGTHSYKDGHVLDTKVYEELGEMQDIAPAQANDSLSVNMQHMAVIRDVRIPK